MRIHCEFTQTAAPSSAVPDGVDAQPDEGTYIHGLFMEGANWDVANNTICDSTRMELYPQMPMMQVFGYTVDTVVTEGVYTCPFFMTAVRGPTFVFSGPLRTVEDEKKWTLAGVALLRSPTSRGAREAGVRGV